MTEKDLQQALTRGEDSRQQFKRDASSSDGIGAKLAYTEQINQGDD